MKKSIILAVVVVVALALAGVGGVFATWSDSEVSMSNVIETGSLDLKVNGADDLPYGTGVPTKIEVDCVIPAKWYGPYEVELWNAGQCEWPSHAYIHFKDVCCFNAPPKDNPYPNGGSYYWDLYYGPGATSGYRCPETGDLKPEPELVAEFGGKVDCHEVPGVGVIGDTCSMKSNVEIIVTDEAGDVLIGPSLIGELECNEIYLFDMEPCVGRFIYIYFRLYQASEEDFGYNFFPNPGEVGFDELEWLKFNDWPSWALMKDKVTFSMEFDLWLEDP